MKAKKMTQKLTLLTFTALFIAFMFNACSDVTSPNENLGNEYSQLSFAEAEEEDMRSRRTRQTTEVEAVTNCTLDYYILSSGNERNRPDNAIGKVTPTLDLVNHTLKLKFEADDDYEFMHTVVHIGTSQPANQFSNWVPGRYPVDNDYPDDGEYEDYLPITEVERTYSISSFSDGETIHVGAKGQMREIGTSGEGDTNTAGDINFHAQHFYFTITKSCPEPAGAMNYTQ